MTLYALVDLKTNLTVEERDFSDTPPHLRLEKGLRWLPCERIEGVEGKIEVLQDRVIITVRPPEPPEAGAEVKFNRLLAALLKAGVIDERITESINARMV